MQYFDLATLVECEILAGADPSSKVWGAAIVRFLKMYDLISSFVFHFIFRGIFR